ncbi:uncharacterized protein LOC132067048 [Lycium ferocissimum]|uniref:uncharacterized protein LOC132067048 n=1 Tax=Lycium ferocissimum TaxID=112874 RepID=UPI002815A3C5|nr:uncharacterized protein LOC132067048 [Lycium ferocissimum]
MSALESPLEALAFNYLSFGLFTVVNNIWAWVAVITAAFSFWRIKTSSTLSKPAIRGEFPGGIVFVPPSEQADSVPANNETSTTSPTTTITSLSPRVLDDELGGTKGKFTTYFELDDVNHHNRADTKGRDEFKILSQWIQNDMLASSYVEEEELCKEWYESWEKVIKTRKREMGWYNCQDLMVINGNVVRLWGGCRRFRDRKPPYSWVA